MRHRAENGTHPAHAIVHLSLDAVAVIAAMADNVEPDPSVAVTLDEIRAALADYLPATHEFVFVP